MRECFYYWTSWGFQGLKKGKKGGGQLTFLVGLVTGLGHAACYSSDEACIGADAFRVPVAGTGDRIDGTVLLRAIDVSMISWLWFWTVEQATCTESL